MQMKHTLRLFAVFGALAIANSATAGEGALAGLRDGFGTSAFSLGNAFTATASDPTALVYNPAGPAQIKRFYITSGTVSHGAGSFASRAALDFGRQYVAGSLTTPKSGTFSVLWRHFGVGDIEQRLTRDDVSTSTFEYKEDWFSAGWSYGIIPKRFFFGIGANYAKMSFDYGSSPGASALGATVGVLYTGVPKLRLGAAVESKMKLTQDDDREDTSPGRGRAGVALGPLGNWLTVAADLEQIHDEPLKAHVGARLEYKPPTRGALQSVHAGGGVSNWALEDLGSGFDTENQRRYSGGAGAVVAFGNVSLAAGYALVSSRFGLDHNLSLSLMSSR
jgi:hypothetical protein